MAFLIVGKPSEPTCSAIVAAACELGLEAAALEPSRLSRSARVGDIVLGRLSVRASLAGVERGLDELSRAVARGIFVLNPPAGILAASDLLAWPAVRNHLVYTGPTASFRGRDFYEWLDDSRPPLKKT